MTTAPRSLSTPSSRSLRTRIAVGALAFVAALGALALTPGTARADAAGGVTPDDVTPTTPALPIPGGIEVGFTFSPAAPGTLTGVQFYQNAADAGVTSASVWSSTGELLARVQVNPLGAVGWRTVPMSVALTAGTTYVASVFDGNGRPPATPDYFASPRTAGALTTPADAGVYRMTSASAFPTATQSASALVDVVFAPAAASPEPAPANTAQPADPPAEPEPVLLLAGSTFGPDGTHWPISTPRADSARVVNVAASWGAISAAIAANARTQDPVVICVAPGTLAAGSGAGSSSKGVVQNVGDAARPTRILVSACDGRGTVDVAGDKGVSFVGVKGVSFVGIDFSSSPVMIRNSEAFSLAYTVVPRLLVTANAGGRVRDVEIVEVAAGVDAATDASGDRVEVKSADGSPIEGLRFTGFYAAPHYKSNGSSAHTDTIQFVTTAGSGTISGVVIEDSVIFQSSDQGIIAGRNVGGTISQSALFGGATGQLRYPVYAGGDPIVLANMLHGTWSDLAIADSVVAGSISSTYTFASVANSFSAKGDRGFAPTGSLTAADVDRLAPLPSTERLAAIWD